MIAPLVRLQHQQGRAAQRIRSCRGRSTTSSAIVADRAYRYESIEPLLIEDLRFLEQLGLIRELPDGTWVETAWGAGLRREDWYAVIEAALLAPDEKGH